MTTFAELYTETVIKTARPELVQLTKSAIKQATLMAHHVDFFPRDQVLVPLVYTLTPQNPIISVPNIYDSVPRLRAVQSLRALDAITQMPTEKFDYKEYEDFYDECRTLRYSVFDIIGSTLKLVSAQQTGLLELVVYQNPDVAENTYSSWIADLYLEELSWWAASIVQARTGALDLANASMKQSVEPFKELLISSHLLLTVN